MNKRKNNSGITLVALVITIIVMLMLAGVSINAAIGDNGIITRAQNATIQSGMAILEEYLQNLYIENFERVEDMEISKVEALQSIYPNYFYSPRANGVGSLNYVVNANGKALFLINKEGLPNEIKNNLRGGDAGEKKYRDYMTLNDVYGVTKDLKVYFSPGKNEEIVANSDIHLDDDDMNRPEVMTSYDTYGSLAVYDQNGDGIISALESRSINKLVIDESTNNKDLSELFHFTNLKSLIIKDRTLDSLNGIDNCPYIDYILLNNSVVLDWSKISTVNNLKKLNIYGMNDDELLALCTAMKNTDYSYLTDLAISGFLFWDKNVMYESNDYSITREEGPYTTAKTTKTITTLYPLSLLTKNTQSNIKTLGINNMNIGNSETELIDENGDSNWNFSYIKDFKGLNVIRAEYNSFKSLIGLEQMSELTNLFIRNNNLGLKEDGTDIKTDCLSSLNGKLKLVLIHAVNNPNLKYVDYLSTDTNIRTLYLAGCDPTMNVNNIINVIKNCGTKYSLPCKFLSGTKYVWSDYFVKGTPTESQLAKGIKQLTAENLKSDLLNNSTIEILDLYNCYTDNASTEITNEVLNTILKSMPQLQYVRLKNTKLSTLDFCAISSPSGDFNADLNDLSKKAFCPLLSELDIQDTYVTDLKNLKNIIKKTNEFPSGRNLHTLRINSKNALDGTGKSILNLTEIQDVLNKCGSGNGPRVNTYSTGMCLCDVPTLKLLENCTELTRIVAYNGEYRSSTEGVVTLDLTKCTMLTSIQQVYYNVIMKLPFSCTSYHSYVDLPPILCPGVNYSKVLTGDYGGGTKEQWVNFWKSVLNAGTIDNLTLFYCSGFKGEYLNDVVKENEFKDRLTTLGNNIKDLKYQTANGEYEWTDLSTNGLQNLKGLKKLSFTRFMTIDTSFLDSMTSIEDLTITRCHLNTTEHLANLVNLQSLDLSDNELLNINGINSLKNNIKNNELTNKLNKIVINNNNVADLSPIDGIETLSIFQAINNNISVSSTIPNRLNADILYDLYKDNNGNLSYLRVLGNNDFIASIESHSISSLSWNNDWLK